MENLAKKDNHQRDLNNLQDATLFLGLALIFFFSILIFNYAPPKSLVKDTFPSIELANLTIHPIERIERPNEVYKISEILKNQQKYLGKKIYLEGYIIDKYRCEKNKNNECDKDIEDFLIVSDFNKKLNDYLVKNEEDINRVIVRAKSTRIPQDIFASINLGEKFIIAGEFIDNLVPIGQTPEGKSIDGLMLVYDKVAVAK